VARHLAGNRRHGLPEAGRNALVDRRPLLRERRCAFDCVVGARHCDKLRGLDGQAVRQRQADAVQHGVWGSGSLLACELQRCTGISGGS